jgi:quercetin dioxygenase-like cupin family protein
MERRSVLAAGAVALVPLPVLAQGAPVAPAAKPSNILFAKDVPIVPMAEWEIQQQGRAEQTGARILIAAGEAELAKAPDNAVRYTSQTFAFPTGSVRVLTFTKAGGGVLHQITSETQLYVVKGSATVGVMGVDTEVGAGDVVNYPSGVMRGKKGAAEDSTVLAFTVGNSLKAPKAAVVRAKDTPETVIAEGEKSGPQGAKVSVQRYTFDGNSIRVARLTGPGKTSVATPATDVLVYLVAGRMQITVGDEVKTVTAGDVLREEAKLPTHWDVAENSMFVATNAPAPGTPQQ